MSENFSELATWAAPLLAKLSGTERRQLMRELAKGLRKRQSDRIKAQKMSMARLMCHVNHNASFAQNKVELNKHCLINSLKRPLKSCCD